MNCPGFIDAEMRELIDAMSKAVVPISKRKAYVKTNWHAPYYSRKRYSKL